MNRADDLEGQIRAVLAAEAGTRRIVAVHRQSPAARRLHRAFRFGVTTLPLTVLMVVVAVAAGLGLADWRAPHAAPSEAHTGTGGAPGPPALARASPRARFRAISTSANT